MTKKSAPYEPFPTFVLRAPLLDFSFYKELVSKTQVQDAQLRNIFKRPEIAEAIFLASPTLYFELKKWVSGELQEKKIQKARLSFLKYLTRMSTRCTPFGLFAGCTLGQWGDHTSISLKDNHCRHTRPDMNYLVALSQDLAKAPHIKKQLTFYPNSSIYVSGHQLRYIEYHYVESSRQHHIVEVDNSEYLQKLLTKASKGAPLDDLAGALVSDTIPKNDAEDFVHELIASQLLISELEPAVSGPAFIDQILLVLKKMEGCENEIGLLEKIRTHFKELDASIGNPIRKYLAISDSIKQAPTPFELKYLFQTDLELKTKKCQLSTKIVDEVQQVIRLFNKITPVPHETNLTKFRDAFFERYEEREMPLCHVLDVETGIGYLQGNDSGDVNPLVDDLLIPSKKDNLGTSKLNWNSFHQKLAVKLDAITTRSEKIVLKDEDFEDFETNWNNLPDTLPAMIEILGDGEAQKIKLSGLGGSSAANLLGRFCHEGSAITDHTEEIIEKETLMSPNKILAEIVHLPESREGNILMRPNFRSYEIPYLAKSILPKEHQIPLQDLYISIQRNKIVLRSKRLDKEVVPHLTNAHNFTSNALPIYQFLCDMQTQGLRSSIGFSFGPLSQIHDYLPRVEYKSVILHEAKWRIHKTDIRPLLDNRANPEEFKVSIEKFKKKFGLPDYVLLADGDNQLLIKLQNNTSVEMLLDSVKNRPEFILTEFLHTQEGCVKSSNSYHLNQVVLAFYNAQKYKQINPQNKEVYATA